MSVESNITSPSAGGAITAASSPTPFSEEACCNSIFWVRCFINPNSPSLLISVYFFTSVSAIILLFFSLLLLSKIPVSSQLLSLLHLLPSQFHNPQFVPVSSRHLSPIHRAE